MTLRYSENNWKDYRTVKAVHDRVHQQPRWMGFAEGVSKSSTTAASFVVGQVLQIEAGAIIALEAVARLPAANLPALALATKLHVAQSGTGVLGGLRPVGIVYVVADVFVRIIGANGRH